MVSELLAAIAHAGTPRCCKRDARVAIREAIRHFNDLGGPQLKESNAVPICASFAANTACINEACPYFPTQAEQPAASHGSNPNQTRSRDPHQSRSRLYYIQISNANERSAKHYRPNHQPPAHANSGCHSLTSRTKQTADDLVCSRTSCRA